MLCGCGICVIEFFGYSLWTTQYFLYDCFKIDAAKLSFKELAFVKTQSFFVQAAADQFRSCSLCFCCRNTVFIPMYNFFVLQGTFDIMLYDFFIISLL